MIPAKASDRRFVPRWMKALAGALATIIVGEIFGWWSAENIQGPFYESTASRVLLKLNVLLVLYIVVLVAASSALFAAITVIHAKASASGRARLGEVIGTVLIVVSLVVMAMGGSQAFWFVVDQRQGVRIIQGQESHATVLYDSAFDVRRSPFETEQHGTIVLLNDGTDMIDTIYLAPNRYRLPLLCATFVTPQMAPEGSRFTYGIVASSEQSQLWQTILTNENGKTSSWIGGYSTETKVLSGSLHYQEEEALGEYAEEAGVRWCLLVDERYINVFWGGDLVASWPNHFGDDSVRIGFVMNFFYTDHVEIEQLTAHNVSVHATSNSFVEYPAIDISQPESQPED